MTLDEARTDPRRNRLRSALTGGEIPLLDAGDDPVEVDDDDILILASDGLETLDVGEIAELVATGRADMTALAVSLVDSVQAAARSSQDNASVITAHLGAINQTLFHATHRRWSGATEPRDVQREFSAVSALREERVRRAPRSAPVILGMLGIVVVLAVSGWYVWRTSQGDAGSREGADVGQPELDVSADTAGECAPSGASVDCKDDAGTRKSKTGNSVPTP